jgi:uncharacterized protein (TIGR02284 family)
MEAKSNESKVERDAGAAHALPARAGMSSRVKASPRAVCSALNRLIVAGRGEILVLAVAARIIDGADRRARLREQAKRRRVFQRDLSAAVTALGGVPATHAASGARLAVAGRRVRELLLGPHEGDAYADCARATEMTATAYAKALRLALPDDVAFGVERQYGEIEWDRSELRRLRWGASPAPLPSPEGQAEGAGAAREADEARALEVWSEEGGSGPAGVANPAARLAGAVH